MTTRTIGVMAVAVLLSLMGCKNQSQQATATVVQAAPAPPPEPVFTAEQNDNTGFDGISWGTPASDQRFHYDRGYDADFHKTLLAKVIGPPVDWTDGSNVGLYEAATNSTPSWGVGLPRGVVMNMKDNLTCYGFYDDKFAFAFQVVGNVGEGNEKVLATMRNKYPLLKTISAEAWGDPPSRTLSPYLVQLTGDLSGYLFRRDETNTRIYLFNHNLMYIPQFYLSAVRERWQKESGEAAATAANRQQE